MGKIIKDGFTFMEYANSRLIKATDDIPALKNELITIGETKTHIQMSEYALGLGKHILSVTNFERIKEIDECFTVIKKWQNKEAGFQIARDAAGVMNDLARSEKDPLKAKVYRAFGQIAATPHVRWHALAASDYAVVIINLMFPKDIDKVKAEREFQISLLNSV